jgi:hypothetical protein
VDSHEGFDKDPFDNEMATGLIKFNKIVSTKYFFTFLQSLCGYVDRDIVSAAEDPSASNMVAMVVGD